MTQSQFQFSDPVLTKLTFLINNKDLTKQESKEIPIKAQTQIGMQTENTAIVALTLDVGEESDNCLFYISVTMQASFRWDEKTPRSMADKLLKSNAPALLLGYVRPYIAQITEASPINTVHIPFMNFTEQQ